jgi:hypothetical protein
MNRLQPLLAGSLLACSVVPRTAVGDSLTRDPVRAEALFGEARRMMATGDYSGACPRFAQSEALDPAPGTALNLATCYEMQGKLASAWAAFRTARSLADVAGQRERADAAGKEASDIEPKLSRIVIVVPPASQSAGLDVRCDGEKVSEVEFGMAVPRDGGGHEIEATSPGRRTWRAHVDLQKSGQRVVVTIPALEEDLLSTDNSSPGASPRETSGSERTLATPESSRAGATQRAVGAVVGVAGVASLAVGGVLGLVAKGKQNTAESETGSRQYDDSASAVGMANLATGVVCFGAALALVGVVFWVTAPKPQVSVATNGHELLLHGSF